MEISQRSKSFKAKLQQDWLLAREKPEDKDKKKKKHWRKSRANILLQRVFYYIICSAPIG